MSNFDPIRLLQECTDAHRDWRRLLHARLVLADSQDLNRHASVVDSIMNSAARAGWIMTTSSVYLLERYLEERPSNQVLAAEIVLDEHRSIHIRHDHKDIWKQTLIARQEHEVRDDGFLVQELFLPETVLPGCRGLLSDDLRLSYEIFWQDAQEDSDFRCISGMDGLSVYRPVRFRFAGFKSESEEL